MNIPRILLAAGASGSGKTLITCGLLQALVNRKMKVASFKCGPDYIDPMFHSRVIGTKSRNLDTFFTDAETTRYLLGKNAADCDIAVMEGVMGYYDGVGGISTKASAYDLADTTDTPVILVVNSRGMSISLAAYIKGFMEYKEKSHIKGVIFNQMSPMLYPRMKKLVEEQLEVEVLGYVPKVEDCVIESRHLGLVLPEEISDLKDVCRSLPEYWKTHWRLTGSLHLPGMQRSCRCRNRWYRKTRHMDIVCHRSCVSEWQRMKPFVSFMKTIFVSFRKWGQSWLISRQFMMNIFLQIWRGFFFMAVIRN